MSARSRVTLLVALAAMGLSPTSAAAQSPPVRSSNVEVFVSVGMGRLWRYQARTFGRGLNVGAGVIVRSESGVGLSLQVDRTFGISRERAGYAAPTVAVVNGHYFFGDGRAQPYLTAGLGLVKSTDVGYGLNLGGGVRVRSTTNVAISPDLQWADGTWMSRSNLSVTRLTVQAAYGR
jgi:hypothetical protein